MNNQKIFKSQRANNSGDYTEQRRKKIKKEKMKSTMAPGQLLGYSLQFPRALFHLLHLPIDGSVGVEVKGDVTSFFPNSHIITEEDKSSINSNPLTNRSTDLWKTFYNWIHAIDSGEIDLDKSRFILYCNKSGQKALVDLFNEVQSETDAISAIAVMKEELNDINEKHEIWKYYDCIINNELIFKDLIKKFELIVGEDAGYDEVRDAIKEKYIPDYFVEYLLDSLSGWLQKTINTKIASKIPAIISFKEFDIKFQAMFHRLRAEALIDWTLREPPKNEAISNTIKLRPNFVKQLDIISIPDDEIVEAVSDFIKADTNRNKWIEMGVIDEDSAIDFENRLLSFWNNSRREVDILYSTIEDLSKGRLILLKCKNRQETINNVTPPDRTISGTYHALSNRQEIGWHPDWKNKINEDR